MNINIRERLKSTSYLNKARYYNQDVNYLMSSLEELEEKLNKERVDYKHYLRLIELEKAINSCGYGLPPIA